MARYLAPDITANHTVNQPYSEDDLRMMRLQAGDAAVFRQIVETWQQPLFRFFLRNTRDYSLSEDMVQETLLRLFRNSWDYLPRGLFRGFLFRIATNLLIDHCRRRTHDVLLHALRSSQLNTDLDTPDLLEQLPSAGRSACTTASDRETESLVLELLQELPEEQRVTFLLQHYDALSLEEIADATATSVPTAKGRLRLAREKLRTLLACRGVNFESSG